MLFQICHTSCKNINTLFVNTLRHYAKTVANIQLNNISDEMKHQKEKVPIIKCKKKVYDFYKGDTYSKRTLLASHGWKNRKLKGDHFFIYPYDTDDIKINRYADFKTFKDFNLNPTMCSNLENLDIHEPLEVQQLGIPMIIEGNNVLLAAETGCGKTLAYLLPLVTKILKWKQAVQRNINCPLALIITPSRELTVQIALELIKISKHLDIKIKIITGGRTKKMILNPPTSEVDVLVCSFGVISKLTTFGVYNTKFIRFVVLDEADSLFHATFEEKLKIFMKRLFVGYSHGTSGDEFPNAVQLILTSATVPSRLKDVLDGIIDLNALEHITTRKLHKILVPQKFIRLIPSDKPAELLKYIKPKVSSNKRVIVFSNHNATSYWLYLFLKECGIRVTNLNGDMPLKVRRGKYWEFLNGKTMVLSTTNGGSRGLDTVMVNHILNYDFPLDTSSYIHRCGRTGRFGSVGESRITNFISRKGEVVVVQKIEMAARKMKPVPIFNLLESDEKGEEEIEEDNAYIENIIDNIEEAENIPY